MKVIFKIKTLISAEMIYLEAPLFEISATMYINHVFSAHISIGTGNTNLFIDKLLFF